MFNDININLLPQLKAIASLSVGTFVGDKKKCKRVMESLKIQICVFTETPSSESSKYPESLKIS
jgi:hypothetical protein